MSFFEKAKLYANIAAEKAKDVAEVAADKAKDVKETAQLTMAIKAEQRELDKNYRAIGQWFASEYQGETPDAVKDVMAAIEASRAKIAEMESALAEKSPADEEPACDAAPQLKACPVCGTATNSRFCPECGAEVSPKAEEPSVENSAAEAPQQADAPADTRE